MLVGEDCFNFKRMEMTVHRCLLYHCHFSPTKLESFILFEKIIGILTSFRKKQQLPLFIMVIVDSSSSTTVVFAPVCSIKNRNMVSSINTSNSLSVASGKLWSLSQDRFPNHSRYSLFFLFSVFVESRFVRYWSSALWHSRIVRPLHWQNSHFVFEQSISCRPGSLPVVD